MNFVPFFVSAKYALHFFPDGIVLTDDECKQELAVFKLNKLDVENLKEWFDCMGVHEE